MLIRYFIVNFYQIQNGQEEEGARWATTTEWRRAEKEITGIKPIL
uniref:Uncharacterized protein n=1 Tax=Saccharolobus solfataricus (strain 98/2) TaxID=555311 RepID=D0KT83_SACS9